MPKIQWSTRNAWQSLAYSPLGAVESPLANTNETHSLLTDRRLAYSSPAPYWTYLKSPKKNFWRRLHNFLCLELRGHWTESHLISTSYTELIADYFAEIKIAFFQSVWKRQRDEWRYFAWYAEFCRITAKDVIVNSVNSEVSGPNATKIVYNVVKFTLLNILKLELRYCNPFPNVSATK